MSTKLFVLLMLCAATLLHAEEYALEPDSQIQPGVPHGVVTKHVLKPGRFYPGTPHNYSVYVPAQYDSAKPTPFMIFLDGSGFLSDKERAPVVFDNLIAKSRASFGPRSVARSGHAGGRGCARKV